MQNRSNLDDAKRLTCLNRRICCETHDTVPVTRGEKKKKKNTRAKEESPYLSDELTLHAGPSRHFRWFEVNKEPEVLKEQTSDVHIYKKNVWGCYKGLVRRNWMT